MARPLRSNNSLFRTKGISIYVQLAELFRHRVRMGIWKSGATLPSIPELMREFKVSRVTVRQAIALLTTEGLLSPERGRGTFVREIRRQRGLRLNTTLNELVELYRDDQPEHATMTSGVETPLISEKDGSAAPAYFHMRRVHSRRGERYCIISVYIDLKVYERAPQRFQNELILPVLKSLSRLAIASGRQVLTISSADTETAGVLGIPLNSPIAEVRRILVDRKGTVIYLADISYRGDVIELNMDLDV